MPCLTPPPRAHLALRVRHHLQSSTSPLFISGPPHVGKRSTIELACCEFRAVDLVLAHSDRLLFGAITQSTPCDASTFLARVREDEELKVLVLFRAERMTRLAPTTPALLFALPQLTRRMDVRVVMVSEQPWMVVRRNLVVGTKDVVSISVPMYDEGELRKMLKKGEVVYDTFVELVVGTLSNSTNDVMTLYNVCTALFPTFERVYRQHKGPNAAAAAFNSIHAELHRTLQTLYKSSHETNNALLQLAKSLQTFIIAAYLAGHNPPSQDTRYFTAIRTKKKAKTEPGGDFIFSLERLLAIYDAIRPDQAKGVQTSMLVQLGTLVHLGILRKEGGDPLNDPKFRCLLPKADALTLSQNVGIELGLYLHD